MSLVNNISAFTNALGADHPDIVFSFASMDWKTEDDRNQFIDELLSINNNQKIGS